jgi:hypothetical protein
VPLKDLPRDFFDLLSINIKAVLLPGVPLFGGITVINANTGLKAMLDVPIEAPNYQSLDFDYTTDKPRSEQNLIGTVGSERQLGKSISNALGNNLLQVKVDTSNVKLLPGLHLPLISDLLNSIVSAVVNALQLLNNLVTIAMNLVSTLKPVLDLVFDELDTILGQLLQALGLQIGYADVELLTVDCNPQLVD